MTCSDWVVLLNKHGSHLTFSTWVYMGWILIFIKKRHLILQNVSRITWCLKKISTGLEKISTEVLPEIIVCLLGQPGFIKKTT